MQPKTLKKHAKLAKKRAKRRALKHPPYANMPLQELMDEYIRFMYMVDREMLVEDFKHRN